MACAVSHTASINFPKRGSKMQRSGVGHRQLRNGAFGFLKTVTHLYSLIRQMRPLCWSCIDVCNAFLVFFPLTFVELRYCGAVACWGANRSIEEYYFLGGGRAEDGISCVLP